MTMLAPTIGQVSARPQVLAWNIGTTGRIVSAADTPMASGSAAIMVCSTLERCE